MCCFSGKVEVADTSIFARRIDARTQAVVYQMKYVAKTPTAMILPLPTPAKSAEDAVQFVNLEKYETFFADLKKGFAKRGRPGGFVGGPGGGRPLKVIELGAFVASFVPTIDDLARLDEQFRLPTEVWKSLPAYRDYGFAVCQLKPAHTKTHPIAFKFPTRPKSAVFFPTVHIHDGEVHDEAEFDHELYYQPLAGGEMLPEGWEESPSLAGAFVTIAKSQGLVHEAKHVYRLQIKGKQRNQDTWV